MSIFLLSSNQLAPIHSLSDTYNHNVTYWARKARPHTVTEDYCMSFSINTNLAALNAHRNLSNIDEQRNNTLQRLSTGLRINKAADDASGLTIANGFQAQSLGIGQAISNATDAT